jgi:hypothetical protein
MIKWCVLLTVLLLFFSLKAISGKSKINFDLQFRYRVESWKGMNAKNYGDDSMNGIGGLDDKLLYQRIITGFTWYTSEKLTFAAHLQDSRALGWSLRNSKYPDLFKVRKKGTLEPYYTMNSNEEFFEIHDAYFEYHEPFSNLKFKLGRQKIFFGDNHIFGQGDWGNTGRWTWDALKVSYRKGKHTFDLFAGGTKTHDPVKLSIPFTRTEYWGGGFYGSMDLGKSWNLEPFYVIKTQGSADYINTMNIDRQWIGFRFFNNNFHSFVFDVTAIQQFGSESNKSINAYGWFAKAGYQFTQLLLKPVVSLRESYASGGKNSDSKIRTFEPAYGASDKYYGWMNIVTWSNLDDREVVLELFPVKDMWVEMKFNRFLIPVPDDIKLLNTMKLVENKHHLGDEFDIFLRWQISKQWQLVSSFGNFWPGDLQPVAGKSAANASWMAIQVLFTL